MQQDSEYAAIEQEGKDLYAALRDLLVWKWDGAFESVLAEFSATDQDQIRSVLEQKLSIVWDASIIDDAPQNILLVKEALGGLRSEQLLFTSNSNRNSFLIGAWWPWGNGETISIRIAPFHTDISDEDDARCTAAFKQAFGL